MLKTGHFLLLRNLNLLSTIQIILLLFNVFPNDCSLILFQRGRNKRNPIPPLPKNKIHNFLVIGLGIFRHPWAMMMMMMMLVRFVRWSWILVQRRRRELVLVVHLWIKKISETLGRLCWLFFSAHSMLTIFTLVLFPVVQRRCSSNIFPSLFFSSIHWCAAITRPILSLRYAPATYPYTIFSLKESIHLSLATYDSGK